ncbi:MAG: mandelate racemase/muconate lactonizing enzyme family protein [Gaiellaceae bacterium]
MKITSVRATPLALPLEERLRWGAMTVGVKGGIVVQVETDEGLTGLGEAGFSAEYFSTVGPIINDQFAPLLVGKDPRDAAALWQEMFLSTHMWGRRGVETYALSGVDIALWDLLGKIAGMPLYQLLGAAKHRVRAYCAPSLKSRHETIKEAVHFVEDQGYTAIKLRVGWEAREALELVRGARKAIGDDIELMVDANEGYSRRAAVELAKAFEQLNVAFFEEPLKTHSLTQYIEEHSWLADRVDVPLAGGESLFTRFEYIDLMERRTFDVVQPDCTSVGGISEAKRVADLASAWNLSCVPHIACSSGTSIGLAAGLHLILATVNTPLIEFDPYGGPGWEGLLVEPINQVDGYVEPLAGPGLGLELADDAFDRFAVEGRLTPV